MSQSNPFLEMVTPQDEIFLHPNPRAEFLSNPARKIGNDIYVKATTAYKEEMTRIK
jgi:hypothetical protein